MGLNLCNALISLDRESHFETEIDSGPTPDGNGIHIAPTSTFKFSISATRVSSNANIGVLVNPIGSLRVNGMLSHVEMVSNQYGFDYYAGNQTGLASFSEVMIEDSFAANNSKFGFLLNGNGVNLSLSRVNATGNANGGIYAQLGTIRLSASAASGNGGYDVTYPNDLSGIVLSYGNNFYTSGNTNNTYTGPR